MSMLNSFISKTALAMLLVASLIVVDHNRVAQAAEEPELINIPGSFSGSFGFFTDYRFRGVSQTVEEAAVQGSFDWSHEMGFYLGVWGSNIDFGAAGAGNTEFDIYFGATREYYGITFDIGGIYYTYPGATEANELDYFEYMFGMSRDFSLISMGTSIYYTPENTTSGGNGTYVVYNAEVPLISRLSTTGHVGYQWIADETAIGRPDTLDWSIGVAYSTHGFDLSLVYMDTDLTVAECAVGCDGEVVFGISRSF